MNERVSAITESLCIHCDEQSLRKIHCSLGGLRNREHVVPAQSGRFPLNCDKVVPWVEGHDLLNEVNVLVPEELCRIDFSRPVAEGYGWFHMTTNGVAAGNTMSEAVLHAICELIEWMR